MPVRQFKTEIADWILVLAVIAAFVSEIAGIVPESVLHKAFFWISLIGILPLARSSYLGIREKSISVDALALVAVIGSIYAGEYSSAAFIHLMLAGARILTVRSERNARRNIGLLLSMRVDMARVKRKNGILSLPAAELKKGDLILIGLGERVPADGSIVDGEAEIDQSMLTGESVPIPVRRGSKVWSGSVTVAGGFTMRAERAGKDTVLEKLILLIERAKREKPRSVSLSEKFARWYIAGVAALSIVAYLYTRDPSVTLSVLLVACADDIAVAIPLAYVSALAASAKRGIIVKSGKYLEVAGTADTLVLDKTGTITKGKMKVEKFVPCKGASEDSLISKGASASSFLAHPASRAIVEFARTRNIEIHRPGKFEERAGKGAIAKIGNSRVVVGRQSFLHELGVEMPVKLLTEAGVEEERGYTVTFLAVGSSLAGYFVLGDEVRRDAEAAIGGMREAGMTKVVMLTGDNRNVARKVASETGIDSIEAELLPEDKVRVVRKYIREGRKVMMIGDGVNDAAALSAANVGVAMGAMGYDAAIESSDIVLMNDDMSNIPYLIAASRRLLSVIRANYLIWAAVNVVGLSLVFGGVLGPAGAAAFNFFTDFIPVLNSFRAYSRRGR